MNSKKVWEGTLFLAISLLFIKHTLKLLDFQEKVIRGYFWGEKNCGRVLGNFLENDFWAPPPLLSILYMDIIDYEAAAAGPSRGARPPSLS